MESAKAYYRIVNIAQKNNKIQQMTQNWVLIECFFSKLKCELELNRGRAIAALAKVGRFDSLRCLSFYQHNGGHYAGNIEGGGNF